MELSSYILLVCFASPLGLSGPVPVYLVSWEWLTRQRRFLSFSSPFSPEHCVRLNPSRLPVLEGAGDCH